MLLPEFRQAHPGWFDLISSVLSLATVLPMIYGLKEWVTSGFSTANLACIAGGAAVGAVFVLRQSRIDDPMLDLHLFTGRQFSGSLAANSIATFALVGNAVFLTQHLQSVLGYTPFVAALWSLAPSVVVGAAAPAAGALGRRVDRATVMAGGFLLAAAGFLLLTQVTAHSSVAVALVGAGALSAGLVAVMTLVTEIAMGSMEPAKAGSAAAVLETGAEFGGALGIAVLGSIGAAIYAGLMAVSIPAGAIPAGIPDEASGAARETLAGATVVSAQLPDEMGAALLADARDAFTAGMHGVGVVGVLLMLGAAVLCIAFLRGAAVGDAEPSEPRPAGPSEHAS